MLSRRHDLQTRLMRAYTLLLGVLLVLIWLGGLLYFFAWERNDFLENARTVASMLATQNSAALMFGDELVLRENLESLKELDGFRWAAVVPVRVDIPLPVVGVGPGSEGALALLDSLGAQTERSLLLELQLREPITHRGEVRGELLIVVDLRNELVGFLRVLAITLLLLAVSFAVGRALFLRIVRSMVSPLDELIQMTSLVASEAKRDAPLEGLPRPETRFTDEFGKLGGAFNEMLDAITRRDGLMREQSGQLAKLVEDLRQLSARMRAIREEERTRISHEIHDELGQRLTTLKYEIARLDSGSAGGRILGQIDELIRTVRVISWELRPSVLDSLGLVAAIEWQAQDFSRRIGIRCSVDLPETEPRLPAEMATDLFRIFQELLTNVSRHARAARVDVILELTESTLHLDVKDDGCGLREPDRNRQSLGLLGIRERLDRWGGTIDFDSVNPESENVGTAIRIEIPLVNPRTNSSLEASQ